MHLLEKVHRPYVGKIKDAYNATETPTHTPTHTDTDDYAQWYALSHRHTLIPTHSHALTDTDTQWNTHTHAETDRHRHRNTPIPTHTPTSRATMTLTQTHWQHHTQWYTQTRQTSHTLFRQRGVSQTFLCLKLMPFNSEQSKQTN